MARGAIGSRLVGMSRALRHPAAAPVLAVATYAVIYTMPVYTTLHSSFVYGRRYGGTSTNVWLRMDSDGQVRRAPDFDTSEGIAYCSTWPVIRYEGFAFDLVGTLNHTIRVGRDGDQGWPLDWSLSQIDQARAIVADAVLDEGRPQWAADLVRQGDGRTIVVNEPRYLLNVAFFLLVGALAVSCVWLPAHCWRLFRALVKAS